MITPATAFRHAAFRLVTAIALITGSVTSSSAQSATPVNQPGVTAPLPKLEKLTEAQCKFMFGHALGMDKKLHHFTTEFKHSLGGFATRDINCQGKPVIFVMTPEDDRGVGILGKLMFDNKQGNLFNSVYIYDPNGIATVSKAFRPNQVLRVLPPELAANAGPAPGG